MMREWDRSSGEDILRSNQQQIIEKAKFTYSPLGKAFEKQIKTIEDKDQKQIDALKDLKQTKGIIYKLNDDDKTSTIRETYNEILEQRIDEVLQMDDDINRNGLVYKFKGPTIPINFDKYGGPLRIYGHLKNGHVTLQQVEQEQKKFK